MPLLLVQVSQSYTLDTLPPSAQIARLSHLHGYPGQWTRTHLDSQVPFRSQMGST
jgi:hypothetical protein